MHINIETKEQFDELVKTGVVLIDFWAPWCGPCRMLAPHLEAIAEEKEGIKVLKVNVDDFQDIAQQFGVSAIPTLSLLVNSEEVGHHVGFLSKPQLEEFITKNI